MRRLVAAWRTFTCQRCGFEFDEQVRVGRLRTICGECEPIKRSDTLRARRGYPWRLKLDPRPERRPLTPMQALRRRLDIAHLGHAYRGLTERQWVDRWNERPDLLDALLIAMELNADRYPGDPRQYLEAA